MKVLVKDRVELLSELTTAPSIGYSARYLKKISCSRVAHKKVV